MCLPPVWPSLPPARSTTPPETDKVSKGQSASQRVVESKEEVLEALEEIARSSDRYESLILPYPTPPRGLKSSLFLPLDSSISAMVNA